MQRLMVIAIRPVPLIQGRVFSLVDMLNPGDGSRLDRKTENSWYQIIDRQADLLYNANTHVQAVTKINPTILGTVCNYCNLTI